MKITVTGGAGFIGSNLCRELLRLGCSVSVLDDFSTGTRAELAGLDVELRAGSVLDPAALAEVCRGARTVVHLAAFTSVPLSLADPVGCHEVNVTGTVRVLEAARKAGAGVLLASSAAVYADLPPGTPARVEPGSPYAISKRAAEEYLLAWRRAYGVPVGVFRLFNVYGPGQRPASSYAAMVPAFLERMLRREPLPVYRPGTQTRSLVYVGTAAAALARAAKERLETPVPVDVAPDPAVSVLDVVAELERLTGRSLEVDYRPPRPGDVAHSQGDGQAFARLFPELVPIHLAEGLRRTLAWYERSVAGGPGELRGADDRRGEPAGRITRP